MTTGRINQVTTFQGPRPRGHNTTTGARDGRAHFRGGSSFKFQSFLAANLSPRSPRVLAFTGPDGVDILVPRPHMF
jgi:hypothetical protein